MQPNQLSKAIASKISLLSLLNYFKFENIAPQLITADMLKYHVLCSGQFKSYTEMAKF